VIEFAQQSNFYLAVDFHNEDLRFNDQRLRQALSLAIDREKLVRDVLHGHGAPSYGAIPPGDEHYDPTIDEAGRYDRREANKMLDELGFTLAQDGTRAIEGRQLSVRCVCQEDSVLRPLAEAVREQLAQIGVMLELEFVVPFAPFYDAVAARPQPAPSLPTTGSTARSPASTRRLINGSAPKPTTWPQRRPTYRQRLPTNSHTYPSSRPTTSGCMSRSYGAIDRTKPTCTPSINLCAWLKASPEQRRREQRYFV